MDVLNNFMQAIIGGAIGGFSVTIMKACASTITNNWRSGVRRKRVKRLQQNWLDFRFCRECSSDTDTYWTEFQMDYYSMKSIVSRYL